MLRELIDRVDTEIVKGREKWGSVDRTPVDLMIAVQEEIGEVAHAINHHEGADRVNQEIAQVIGILSRLYEMAK
ncbi:unnamed protein product [marine sediment metagenome]|uniref:NTP pyrophosphohydrolase MazG putative catalytic core domain-containing protein n=1 Tax=marine sediment metagenome TaxID=412755 RepID=X1ELP6_9ZZZZ